MLESWASPDMQDMFPPCLTAALQINLTDGEARANAADRAVQDLKQQVQQLQAQVEESTISRAAQAAQLTGVQNELGNTKQQLQALNTINQVHAFTIHNQPAFCLGQWDVPTVVIDGALCCRRVFCLLCFQSITVHSSPLLLNLNTCCVLCCGGCCPCDFTLLRRCCVVHRTCEDALCFTLALLC